VAEPRLYECDRCHYHYPKDQMAREQRTNVASGKTTRRIYCLDRYRCDRHIAQREADQEALK
jgi:hypothetical protein